jgi:hypothetical protein
MSKRKKFSFGERVQQAQMLARVFQGARPDNFIPPDEYGRAWYEGQMPDDELRHMQGLIKAGDWNEAARFMFERNTAKLAGLPLEPIGDQTLRLQDEMDAYFYTERCKPKHESGSEQEILDRARHHHKDWPCPGSIQGMNKRVKAYWKKHEKPKPPIRKG